MVGIMELVAVAGRCAQGTGIEEREGRKKTGACHVGPTKQG